jgi:hypothetical protein
MYTSFTENHKARKQTQVCLVLGNASLFYCFVSHENKENALKVITSCCDKKLKEHDNFALDAAKEK